MQTAHILIANVGSTSLKYTLFYVNLSAEATSTPLSCQALAEGSIERIGMPGQALVEHLRPDSTGQMQTQRSYVEAYFSVHSKSSNGLPFGKLNAGSRDPAALRSRF